MKFSTKVLVSVLLAGSAFAAVAADIKGKLIDSSNEALTGVSAQLIALPDSTRAANAISGVDGSFALRKVKKGKYTLQLRMLGMDPKDISVEVPSDTATIDLGTLSMLEEGKMLNEVVVKGVKAAVSARSDTLEYNAGSFRTKQNATVEDLLKKLPGVEVGSDGSITSGGKTISKILVDGKEFFSDDPTVASKNLPSNMVEKVQVMERKSDQARLTGVDDGEEETVINLTVKKGMNNGWFGNVSAGYGTDGRYEGSFMINRFSNGNQITFIGGANNTNEMGFSDMGRGNFRNFGGNNGINSTQRFGINFNIGNEEKFRIGGHIFYTHSDRKSTSVSESQYLFPDSVSYQNSNSYNRDQGHNIRARLRMQWNIDDHNTLEFRPNFSWNHRNSLLNEESLLRAGDANLTKVNSNDSRRSNRGDSYQAGGNLIFNHKFNHPGRSFSIEGEYNFSDTREKGITWSDIEYFLRQEDSETLYRFLDNHSWSNTVRGRLTYTEPLGDAKNGHFLQIAYMANYRWNNADQLTYNLPLPDNTEGFIPAEIWEKPDGLEPDPVLSNRFRNAFFNQQLQVGYKRTTSKLNLDAGLQFSPASSKSTDLINSERNIPTRWVWNIAPYMRMRYRFTKTSALMVNYRARTSQPSMSQLQPVPDVSDPLNIKVGNPDLKPTFTQSIMVHYNNFNMSNQQSIFAMLNASLSTNSVVSRTITDKETGSRTTTYTNANGNFNIFGMLMINQPLRNKKWRFNARFNGNYSSSAGYLNGDFNRSGNLGLSPSAGITFSCDVFQMSVNPTYRFSMATSTLQSQANRYTHTYGFNADAELDLPFGLSISSDISYSNMTGYSSGFNSSEWLWNAQISYSVLRDKSLTFSARAFDLLGQKKNISRSVSESLIRDVQYNDLTRYFMFGITYKFNTLTSRNKGPRGEDMGPGFGPGPGPRGGRGRF